MRWFLPLAVLPFLAACSEQQMCISSATKDLRVVRGFVTETEGNLRRGYALIEVDVIDFETRSCGTKQDGSTKYCRVPVRDTELRPKAIDLDAEAAKLASLKRKEAQLAAAAEQQIAACKVAYPDG
ncbi:hypothetical protein [Celeribacter marinus]|uniref:Uncharacterized protein n=1 Tax=Celeribacter marinus TaxID=1397108 RepID=A0A0P0A9I9_9RHOB|nr:hypothetical protein [Celeribacter marinus]ALI55203.1 hypothetical protein IMCC12053_1255 [Celeribacter marinus]SFK09413.1 hypothetical protein SAMN05444421_101404 [Celeribacter marinus]